MRHHFMCAGTLLLFSGHFSSAHAQIIDRISELMVDQVNTRVTGRPVDPRTRELQIAGARVLLRGSEADWSNLLTAGVAAATGAPSPSPDRQPSAPPSSPQFREELTRVRHTLEAAYRRPTASGVPQPPAAPTAFMTVLDGRPLSIRVPPYPYRTEGQGCGTALRRPTYQRAGSLFSISRLEADGDRRTVEYAIVVGLEFTQPDRVSVNNCEWSSATGYRLLIVDNSTGELDVTSGLQLSFEYLGDDRISTNVPPIYTFDWDRDGHDEIMILLCSTPACGITFLRRPATAGRYADVGGETIAYNRRETDWTRTAVHARADGIAVRGFQYDGAPFAKLLRFQRGTAAPTVTPLR